MYRTLFRLLLDLYLDHQRFLHLLLAGRGHTFFGVLPKCCHIRPSCSGAVDLLLFLRIFGIQGPGGRYRAI